MMKTTLLPAVLTLVAVGLGSWVVRLRRDLAVALTDPVYGILTRHGGELEWRRWRARADNFEVVFLDLDGLHHLNAQWGYPEVDRRIRGAFSHRDGDIVMARWYSGDEVIAVVPKGDGAGYAERLQCSLRQQDLSATFAVVPATPDLADAVAQAMRVVMAAKGTGQRNMVCGETPAGGRRGRGRRVAATRTSRM